MICYVVTEPWMKKTLEGRFCTVHVRGIDDLCLRFNEPGRHPGPWFCEWCSPFEYEGRMIHGCYVHEKLLRPVSGPSAAPIDEPTRLELVA